MNRLKKLRNEKRLTIRELGEETNISYSSISAMENEIRPFTQGNLEILCSFFNVSSDYLLGLSDERNPTSAKEQLSGIQLAFYNQAEELTEAQAKEVLNYIEFVKNRDSKK